MHVPQQTDVHSIGLFDCYLFQAVGRPIMIPYWALGFHLSRYGYDHIDTLKETVDRMRYYDIPHVSELFLAVQS